jgi:hypothetical protein
MQAYGGTREYSQPISTFVSLTRSGYPRRIPAFHRRQIMERSEESDRLVQFYLSLFGVNKLILLAPKVGAKTLSSFTDPSCKAQRTEAYANVIREKVMGLMERYVSDFRLIPLVWLRV